MRHKNTAAIANIVDPDQNSAKYQSDLEYKRLLRQFCSSTLGDSS